MLFLRADNDLGFCGAHPSFHLMRKTKIICTLGPATEKTETLRELLQEGADVFRLNMSHAKHEWVREIVPRIRAIAAEIPRPVAILLDTQGPAIRTGELKTNLKLKPGDILEFTVRGAKSEEKYSVDVNYEGLVNDISVGRCRPGRQRRDAAARVKKGAQPNPLQSADAGRARFPSPHQSAGSSRKPAAVDAEGSRRHRARRRAEGGFRRAQFCPQEKRPPGIASRFEEGEKHRKNRGENRGSIRSPPHRPNDRRRGRGHDRARRSRDRMPDGRAADHSTKDRETLPADRKAGHRRHPYARIDDRKSGADAGGNHRRGQCRFRTNRRDHVERRNLDGPVSGGMREGFRSGGAPDRAERRRWLWKGRHSRGRSPEDMCVSRRPGQFTAARKTGGLHAPWHDGALRFQSSPGERADLCVHVERGSFPPDRDQLGNASGDARVRSGPKCHDRVGNQVSARQKANEARRQSHRPDGFAGRTRQGGLHPVEAGRIIKERR